MFVIVYAIISPGDEQLSHNLSIIGTIMYGCDWFFANPRFLHFKKLFSVIYLMDNIYGIGVALIGSLLVHCIGTYSPLPLELVL